MMRLNVVVYFILERLSWQSRRVSVVIARELKSSSSYLIHTHTPEVLVAKAHRETGDFKLQWSD